MNRLKRIVCFFKGHHYEKQMMIYGEFAVRVTLIHRCRRCRKVKDEQKR